MHVGDMPTSLHIPMHITVGHPASNPPVVRQTTRQRHAVPELPSSGFPDSALDVVRPSDERTPRRDVTEGTSEPAFELRRRGGTLMAATLQRAAPV